MSLTFDKKQGDTMGPKTNQMIGGVVPGVPARSHPDGHSSPAIG